MCLDQEIRQSPLLVVRFSVIGVFGLTMGTVGYMLWLYFNPCALSRVTDVKWVVIKKISINRGIANFHFHIPT